MRVYTNLHQFLSLSDAIYNLKLVQLQICYRIQDRRVPSLRSSLFIAPLQLSYRHS